MDTVTRGEVAEAQIDAFIERRHEQRVKAEERSASQDAATRREEAWKAGVERHARARRRENRAAWFAYFCQQAQAHAAIAEDYERRAEELCEGGDAA